MIGSPNPRSAVPDVGRFVRRALALLGVVISLWFVPTGSAAPVIRGPGTSPPAGDELLWRPCNGSFECAQLTVPILYAHPGVGTINLAVIELASTSSHPLGDLVLNPGGPGASGVQFLEATHTSFPASLRAAFNLVSFDPRGIGKSAPLSCGSLSELRSFTEVNPAPSTPAEVTAVIAETKKFVATCQADSPRTLLDNVGTVDTVQDLDRLRVALGEAKLTYMGFSYGTYLGELYAEKYPAHVRAMVLDGAIDPALGSTQSAEEQADGFEQDLRAFFSWCAGTSSCRSSLPASPLASYDELFSRLEAGAVIPSDGGSLGSGLPAVNFGVAEVGVISTLYTSSTWPALGEALSAALRGDGTAFSRLALGYEGLTATAVASNVIAANTAINCEDSGALGSIAAYEALAHRLALRAPNFGPSEAWGSFTCKYWGVHPAAQPRAVSDNGAPPIVVIGATEDPATPYSWAQGVQRQLNHGVLLTRTGVGHTSYFYSSCVQSAVGRYLLTLAPPRAGTVCPTS